MIRTLSSQFLQLASAASIIGLYFSIVPPDHPHAFWHKVVLVSVVIIALILAAKEIYDYNRSRPRQFNKQTAINEFMRRWISSGRRAVIFSRDMSWADEPTTKDLLFRKARNGELTIFIEHDMAIAAELRQAGAVIYRYGNYNHLPRSRFTIIDYGQEGARVAVGVGRQGGRHEIKEYHDGDHPLFALAEDFVRILENSCERIE